MKTNATLASITMLALAVSAGHAQPESGESAIGEAEAAAQPAETTPEDISTDPVEEHQLLAKLDGVWNVEVEYVPIGRMTGELSNRMIMGDRYMLVELTGEFDGEPVDIVRVFGYNKTRNRYETTAFGSNRTSIEHGSGVASEDGTKITFEGDEGEALMRGGRRYTDVLHFVSDDEFTYTRSFIIDGKPMKSFEARCSKSRLIIEDVIVGEGTECKAGDTVTVHYKGMLKDGTVFDENWDSDPITFPLTGLIQGWQDGIPGMKVGGVRKLTIPYHLAYGAAGRPPVIPPKATLIFDIKLVGVGGQ